MTGPSPAPSYGSFTEEASYYKQFTSSSSPLSSSSSSSRRLGPSRPSKKHPSWWPKRSPFAPIKTGLVAKLVVLLYLFAAIQFGVNHLHIGGYNRQCNETIVLSFLGTSSSYTETLADGGNRHNTILTVQQRRQSSYTNTWLLSAIPNVTTTYFHLSLPAMKNRISELIHLSCMKNIGIFLLVSEDTKFPVTSLVDIVKDHPAMGRGDCAPFVIKTEHELNHHLSTMSSQTDNSLIEKLSYMRDIQRDILRRELELNQSRTIEKGVVIVADFDLEKWPSEDILHDKIQHLLNETFPHDALCSNGYVMEQQTKEPKYRDTFSTVLYPDTFLTTLEKRLFPYPYEGEDEWFVRSDGIKSTNSSSSSRKRSISQEQLWRMFQTMGHRRETGAVRVRSCFGGLTIYRAHVYFDRQCRYQLDEDIIRKGDIHSIMRYAIQETGRPSEHVVFHECIRKMMPHFDIAIDSKLVTMKRLIMDHSQT